MSLAIWKFQIPEPDAQGQIHIKMPVGAKVLHVGMQGTHWLGAAGGACMWAEVNPEHDVEYRDFRVFATGESIPEDHAHPLAYRGTLITEGFVWHVYE